MFLDFGDRNFDEPEIISPTQTESKILEETHTMWHSDDLAELIAPSQRGHMRRRADNESSQSRNQSLDAVLLHTHIRG